MSQYSSDYKRRMPVLVDNRSGSATIDVSFAIPGEWGAFWGAIDSNGYGLRVTESDGVTLVDYQLASWTYATRTATIEVDAWSPATDDGWVVLWLYWDIDSPTDGAASFTAASAKTGYIHIAAPQFPMFRAYNLVPGATTPTPTYQTDPTAVHRLLLDFTAALQTQSDPLNGSVAYEEPAIIEFAATDGGSAATNTWFADSVRLHVFGGKIYASVSIYSGTSTSQYMDTFTITTTTGRTLVYSAARYVQTPAE